MQDDTIRQRLAELALGKDHEYLGAQIRNRFFDRLFDRRAGLFGKYNFTLHEA